MPLSLSDWEFTKWLFREEKRQRRREKRRIDSKFITVYLPQHHFARKNGSVLQHRLIWEQQNKAVLLPWVRIVHKNKNRLDNRIENLEVRISENKLRYPNLSKEIPILLKKMGLQ